MSYKQRKTPLSHFSSLVESIGLRCSFVSPLCCWLLLPWVPRPLLLWALPPPDLLPLELLLKHQTNLSLNYVRLPRRPVMLSLPSWKVRTFSVSNEMNEGIKFNDCFDGPSWIWSAKSSACQVRSVSKCKLLSPLLVPPGVTSVNRRPGSVIVTPAVEVEICDSEAR